MVHVRLKKTGKGNGLFPDQLPELKFQLTWTYGYIPGKEPLIEVQAIRNKGVQEMKIAYSYWEKSNVLHFEKGYPRLERAIKG